MKNIFYVYEWYNIKTNFIFYIGKGCKNRYKQLRKRNKMFIEYYNNYECSSRIIKYFDNEQDAFNFEKERILELKRNKQATCNLDYGGKGGCNFVWTKEMREYKAKYNPMKNDFQKERMSKNNPMKNPNISEKVAETNKKPVIINDMEYSSVKEAVEKLHVSPSTIKKWCAKGVNNLLQPCRYKNEEQKIYNSNRYNKCSCKRIKYKDQIYESNIDLAKELGLSQTTTSTWAKNGFDPQGNACRYLDDDRNIIFYNQEKGEFNKKPIIVNGILYCSKTQAEKELGLCKGYLAPYIKGTRKNKKYICEYVNQQPSHKKSKYRIVEGSTTNE